MDVKQKRENQKKELWIKNVMNIQGLTKEEAEKLYKKCQQ